MKEQDFDYIVLAEVLKHVWAPERAVLNIRDSFSESVFVSIPNSRSIMHRLSSLFDKFPAVMIFYHVKEHILLPKSEKHEISALRVDVANTSVSGYHS